MDLGKNILKSRKKLQLSQEQLGQLVGVTRQTISNWELNETVPDARQLLALSRALQIGIDALVDMQMMLSQNEHGGEADKKRDSSKRILSVLTVMILLLILAFISAS